MLAGRRSCHSLILRLYLCFHENARRTSLFVLSCGVHVSDRPASDAVFVRGLEAPLVLVLTVMYELRHGLYSTLMSHETTNGQRRLRGCVKVEDGCGGGYHAGTL